MTPGQAPMRMSENTLGFEARPGLHEPLRVEAMWLAWADSRIEPIEDEV